MDILQQLKERYRLELSALRLERRYTETEEKLRRAKWDLRGCEEKLLNYEGSIRGFLDKFSGKKEDRAEELRRSIRQAKAVLDSLQQQKASVDRERAALTAALEECPSMESLRDGAAADETLRKEWAQLEVGFCREALIPLLEENGKALLELRSLLQGNRASEILSAQQQQAIYAEPDKWARRCVPLLQLLTGLFVALWTLLLIIPGIIAALKYAMAPFIMLENPGMKPRTAMNASAQLMEGHKWELFVLELSFIGWGLLNVLTLGIGSLWLNPYMNAAYTAFYRNISAQPRIESAPCDF